MIHARSTDHCIIICVVICRRKESGLPFYDVILAKELPKVASLPVATSQLVRARLLNGTYDFDYIYFTESDQVH